MQRQREFIEQDCTVVHDGRQFTSGGAFVTETLARGYLQFDTPEMLGVTGSVTDWHGNLLGTARIVGKWPTPRSWMSSHMLQVECCIDGISYTGRGAGNGMAWTGNRCAAKK